MDRPKLILASQSPRRRMLLEAAGVDLTVVPSDADESLLPGEHPIAYALRVARAKAAAVAGKFVLAADTVVALDAEVLLKTEDEEEAVAILKRLAGRTHTVHTAVVLLIRENEARESPARELADIVSTGVRFRSLSEDEIRRYVATREPMDKAGAYGIQGHGGALVAEVHGSYTNVVGLPLEETLRMLELAGAHEAT
jgi:septum formation protein